MALFGGGSSDEMKIVVTAETTDAKTKLDELDQSIKKVSDSGETASGGGLFSAKGAFLGLSAAAGTAVAGVALLSSQLDKAMQVQNLTSAFNSLQKSVGSDTVGAMQDLQVATGGMINNLDLMKSANQAVLLGVDKGNGDFPKLAAAAIKLGQAMGITAKEGIDSVVTGLGKGSKEVLDNLGVIISLDDAYKQYAKQIHKNVDALTELDKKQAVLTIGSQAIIDKANTMADTTSTAATEYQKLKVAISNASDEMTTAVGNSDSLELALKAIRIEIEKMPSNISTWVSWLEKAAAATRDAALTITDMLLPGYRQFLAYIKDQAISAFTPKAYDLSRGLKAVSIGALEAAQSTEKANKYTLNFGESTLKLDNSLIRTNTAYKGLNDSTIKASAGFNGLTLDLDKTHKKLVVVGDGSDKAKEKLYKLADIGKELSQKILGQDLTQIVEELGQGFGDGAIKADQLTKILENSRDAFIKLGLSAQQADSIIKGIKLTPTPTPNKPGGTTGGTPNLLGDLFSGIFGTPVAAGGSSGTADTAAATFAANLGLQVQNKLSDGIVAAFEGNDIGNSIKGLAGSLASAVATSFGGPIAGSLAQVGVSVAGSIIDQVSAGKQISGADQTKAALLTGGMSLFATAGYNAIIGGSKSPEEEARKQIENFLESTLGENVIFGNFQDNFADSFSNITGNAQSSFTAIGDIIRSLTGVSEEVGAQIGYILADNFGGTIDDLKYLVSDLGLTFEQVQDQMVQAFLSGDQTAQEVISTLAGLEEAFKPGLEGAGQFTKAMDNLIASMGTGKESLKSLKDLAVEFKETGGKTLGEFQNALEASGKYTSAQIQQLFQALSQRGITSLDQLAGASDLALIGIIADLQTLGFKFADSIGGGVKDSIDDINKLRDTISKLPETIEKNIKINVSTNYSDSQAKGALAQLTGNSSPGIARQ